MAARLREVHQPTGVGEAFSRLGHSALPLPRYSREYAIYPQGAPCSVAREPGARMDKSRRGACCTPQGYYPGGVSARIQQQPYRDAPASHRGAGRRVPLLQRRCIPNDEVRTDQLLPRRKVRARHVASSSCVGYVQAYMS